MSVVVPCEGYACPPTHKVPASEVIVERVVGQLASTGADAGTVVGIVALGLACVAIGLALLSVGRKRTARGKRRAITAASALLALVGVIALTFVLAGCSTDSRQACEARGGEWVSKTSYVLMPVGKIMIPRWVTTWSCEGGDR